MAGPMRAIDYVSDDGATYRMRLDASNGTVAGGVAATSTLVYPRGWVPRYVLAQHPTTGRERRIIVPDPGSALWTGGGGTLTLRDYGDNTDKAFNIRGHVGERRYARAT